MNIRKRVASILQSTASALMPIQYTNPVSMSDMNEGVMIDFNADRFNTGMPSVVTEGKDSTLKISISPRDVLDELKRPPTNVSLSLLDAKLAILEKKKNLIVQQYSKEHVEFLIMALTNRKKFDKRCHASNNTYREFFSSFDITDELKIKALTAKYELVMKVADLFIPEFPDSAIEIMDKYAKVVKELTAKLPRFYVIATTSDFRDVTGRRDPILLAQSPFGMYYCILGVWDKEMLYLPEL